MSNNLDAVQAISEAFGKGDIPGILERLSEAVRWEQWADNEAQKTGVPWWQSRIGKEGVAELFKIVGSTNLISSIFSTVSKNCLTSVRSFRIPAIGTTELPGTIQMISSCK